MPTYQYRCTECAHDLEAVQKFTDPALTECPSCSGSLRKVYNAVGVVFKGSGFYRTDSRKAPSEAGPGSNGAAETKNGNGAKEKSSDGAKAPAKESATTSSSSSSSTSSPSSTSTGTKTATS